mgnify:CR=1 FL=1
MFKICRNGDGSYSLKRSIAFTGFIIMSVSFVSASIFGRITADMFVTFPLGLVILYVPQLAVTLLRVWRGTER